MVIHHWLICLISQTLIQKANAVYFKVNSVAIRTLFIAIFSHGADRINLGKDWRGMNVLCVFCLRKNTGKTYCFNFELLLIVFIIKTVGDQYLIYRYYLCHHYIISTFLLILSKRRITKGNLAPDYPTSTSTKKSTRLSSSVRKSNNSPVSYFRD